jgi:hypothetical protein
MNGLRAPGFLLLTILAFAAIQCVWASDAPRSPVKKDAPRSNAVKQHGCQSLMFTGVPDDPPEGCYDEDRNSSDRADEVPFVTGGMLGGENRLGSAASGKTDRDESPIERLVSPKPENLVAKVRLLYARQSPAMPVIEKNNVEVESGNVFSSDRYIVRFSFAGSNGPYDVDVNVPVSSQLPLLTFVTENTGNFVKLLFLISRMEAPLMPAEITVSFYKKENR